MRQAFGFAGIAQTRSWIEGAMASYHVDGRTLVVCQNCLSFKGQGFILGIRLCGVKGKTHVDDSFFHKL